MICGAGVAGMSAAIQAADAGLRVGVVAPAVGGSTRWAAGGVAVSRGADVAAHAADTLRVGGGDARAADILASGAAAAEDFLRQAGVRFSADIRHEAGHSRPRILCCGDQTGAAIARALRAAVSAHPRIMRIIGSAYALAQDESGRVVGLHVARAGRHVASVAAVRGVIICTGGFAGLYPRACAPPSCRGDGIWMAHLAGAKLGDMAVVQFHPTALNTPRGRAPLLSETLRGAGARVVDARGNDIAPALTPRDALAAAVEASRAKGGGAFLDFSAHPPRWWAKRFPAAAAALARAGLDFGQRAPIRAAAHFCCGGIGTDLCGRTSLPSLLAAGEAACTDLHGRNRLGSNALLEGIVFGRRAANAAAHGSAKALPNKLPAPPQLPQHPLETPAVRQQAGRLLAQYFGVFRTPQCMEMGRKQLQHLGGLPALL